MISSATVLEVSSRGKGELAKNLRCQHSPDEEEVKEEVQCRRDFSMNGHIITMLSRRKVFSTRKRKVNWSNSPAQQKADNQKLCRSDPTPHVQERKCVDREERV